MLRRLWWFTMWNTNWYVTKEHARSLALMMVVVVVFLFFWRSFALTRYAKWRNNHPQPTSISSESSSKERERVKEKKERRQESWETYFTDDTRVCANLTDALGQTSITFFVQIAVNLIGQNFWKQPDEWLIAQTGNSIDHSDGMQTIAVDICSMSELFRSSNCVLDDQETNMRAFRSGLRRRV